MTAASASIRAATVDDVAAIRAVVDAVEAAEQAAAGPFPAAGTAPALPGGSRGASAQAVPPLDARSDASDAAAGHPEAIDAYYRHLVARGDVFVFDGPAGVIAFGATIDTGRGVHLADLFVHPAQQGRGLGRRLLARLFGDRWPRTTFSSDDPRAMPLYVRMGMRPLWPNLYVMGDARRLVEPADVRVERVEPGEVRRWERAWAGIDRPLEHAYWGSQPAAASIVVVDGTRAVAAGHVRDRLRGSGRWVNTFLVAPGVDPHDPTLAVIRSGGDADGRIGACVPGPHPILRTLVGAGFRIVDRDTYQASDPRLVDPVRVLVNTGIL